MQRRAVLVGINAYPAAPLAGCVPDALRDARIFREPYHYAESDVVTLLDADATTRAVKGALLASVVGLADGDWWTFTYSGHGAQTVDGDARTDCLCPVDFDWSPDRLISADWLHNLVSAIPPGVHVRVILDACHSGDTLRNGIPRPGQPVTEGRAFPGQAVPAVLPPRHIRFRDLVQSFPSAGFLAACQSSETAADASFTTPEGGTIRQGALSYYRQAAIEANPTAPLSQIAAEAIDAISRAGFAQHPVLRGPTDELSAPFATV